MNDTLPSFQRGDKVCRPADWIDVVKFFGFNFALHALTVFPLPGANIFETTVTSLCAILIPISGVRRAMLVLQKLVFLWGGDELGKALSAGALCTLVPAGCALGPGSAAPARNLIMTLLWDAVVPPQDPMPAGFNATTLEQVNPLTTVVHGRYPADIRRLYTKVPGEDELATRAENGAARLEYTLVAVPPSFSVVPLLATDDKHTSLLRMLWDKVRGRRDASGGPVLVPLALSCNYSLLKTSAALIQILYGSYELYMVSDDQIRRYGYAAYQFTVIPYVGMSILNLLAGLSAPSYSARYIVHYRGLETPLASKTKEPATSGDPAEHDNQVVPAISLPAEGTGADISNGAAAMEEEAEMRSKEIYPPNWWNEEERAAVERMVVGEVGYVYGDFSSKGLANSKYKALGSFSSMVCALLIVTGIVILLASAVFAAPYVAMQVLTGFGNGESTVLQRVFIMAWIVCGQSYMVFSLFVHHNNEMGAAIRRLLRSSPVVAAFAVAGIVAVVLFPPVAGFYTVSKMILNDRTCSRV